MVNVIVGQKHIYIYIWHLGRSFIASRRVLNLYTGLE
jgi:hypothetical protein